MRYLIPLAAVLALAACDPGTGVDPTEASAVGDDLTGDDVTGDDVADGDVAVEADDEAMLLFMREEEKLARDVYNFLDETWDIQVFTNIEQSEQSHMDALLAEIERLGLTDPVVDDSRGVFQDQVLAGLYEDLTTSGAASVEDALAVGALIEDLDIIDLQDAAAATADPDLAAIYATLECGSRNHLRAFTGQLDQLGVIYEPQFLSDDAFLAIITTEREQC